MQFMASWSPMRRWHNEDYFPISSYTPLFSEVSDQSSLGTDMSSVCRSTDLSSKNQLMWNHYEQLNSDTNGSFQQENDTNNTDEKFLELLSSRSLPNEIFADDSNKINSFNNTLHDPERMSIQSNFSPSMSHYPLHDTSHSKLDQCSYNYNQELFGNNNSNVDSVLELDTNKLCDPMMDVPWSCTANLAELISFNSSKVDLNTPKTNTSNSKKRKGDDNSGANLKRSKQQSSTTTPKVQVPNNVKREKISALQQLVAPFGKTDTASVLFDAIKYIEYLHEQVQLLSDPYIKSITSCKDPKAIWGSIDMIKEKEGDDLEIDLRSRGLCLIPVSCTPQVCRDNGDYWAPPYRSYPFR